MIIGVTGKSGSGKSTISREYASRYGFVHIDIDKIGHEVLALPHIKALLVEAYSERILDESAIDRKKLGDIVFTGRHAHPECTDKIWGEMVTRIDDAISDKSQNYILDWVLLPKTKYWEQICDYTVVVHASNENLRKKFVIIRDNITEDYLNKRDSMCPHDIYLQNARNRIHVSNGYLDFWCTEASTYIYNAIKQEANI